MAVMCGSCSISVCTGLPTSELSAQLQLPSYSTQHRALLTAAEGRKEQVAGIVNTCEDIGPEPG